MWGLGIFFLLFLSVVGGAAAGLIWFLERRKGRRPSLAALIAIPLGCVAIPILALVLFAVVHSLLQSSDTELYEEIFGYRPTITEDRMLFDDFGSGGSRAIFMRAEPSDAERDRLFSIAGAVPSEYTLADFIARGEVRGFMWWMSAEEWSGDHCKSARILDAHGYRGWREFRIAECIDAGTEYPGASGKGQVYVIASGRSE